MLISRLDADQIIWSRVGLWAQEVGLEHPNPHLPNPHLNDALSWSLRQLGTFTLNVPDEISIAQDDFEKFLDFAEYRALLTIQQNNSLVDLKIGPRSESFNQLAKRIEMAIAHKKAQLVTDYGFGEQSLESGALSLGFQEILA